MQPRAETETWLFFPALRRRRKGKFNQGLSRGEEKGLKKDRKKRKPRSLSTFFLEDGKKEQKKPTYSKSKDFCPSRATRRGKGEQEATKGSWRREVEEEECRGDERSVASRLL